MTYPIRGNSYFAYSILHMDLPDSPFFTFTHNEKDGTIQTSHCTVEQLLAVPGFADTLWVYMYTTNEEIPIFKWDGSRNASMIHNFVDLEEMRDAPDEWWATPKGLPREQ